MTNTAPAPVGEALKALRDDLSLSQSELDAEAGISPATVNNIENNNIKRPHPSTVRKLAAV